MLRANWWSVTGSLGRRRSTGRHPATCAHQGATALVVAENRVEELAPERGTRAVAIVAERARFVCGRYVEAGGGRSRSLHWRFSLSRARALEPAVRRKCDGARE